MINITFNECILISYHVYLLAYNNTLILVFLQYLDITSKPIMLIL